ncbi:MAG TPA: preprotein translocase subunit SecY [Candidatus Saccharimonadales bacterium]|nr:preprotein translocase subunit SecY [Candidatus Saccharimonadales bacterium]
MFKIFKYPELRKKIIFTLFVIVVFRLLANIPIPGVDAHRIKDFLSGNTLFGLFNLFSGGGLQNFSIATLGLNPYINASIIMQLFTFVIPQLEELQKEGESGQERINMYTRLLTVPLALLQSYGMYFLLNKQGILPALIPLKLVVLILTMTAGTILLMWIGELVTEYGVGNGVSLIIFAGIISRLPQYGVQFYSTLGSQNLFNVAIFLVLSVIIIAGVVLVNEGTRNIEVEYGRKNTGTRTEKVSNYLPIKINQAGVIPIIFAVSVMLVPTLISGPLLASKVAALQNAGSFLTANFTNTSTLYNVVYFLLVVGFTYFYTSVQFNPEKIADDIKKRGGFVPGIRPGSSTTKYLSGVINKITLPGAIFLGAIAVLPFIIQSALGVSTFSIGGTSLLIVVSVVLETIRQIESLMVTKNYYTFLE